MADYSTLIATINNAIKTNGAASITGQALQTILDGMVASLGDNYQCAGVATPSTDPGTPDENVFYIAAEEGTYTNFGSAVVANEVALLMGTGSTWTKVNTGIKLVSVSQNTSTGHTDITVGDTTTPVASVEEVSQLGQETDNKLSKKLDIELDDDAFFITDKNGYAIVKIDKYGIHSVNINNEPDNVVNNNKLVITDANGYVVWRVDETGVHTVNQGKIDNDKLVITDSDGYIIASIDNKGLHSAQTKESVASMVLGENYYPTATPTRDGDGNVTHAEVMFATGVSGTIDVAYTNGLCSSVDVVYGQYEYAITIARDGNGNVQNVLVEEVTL